MRNFLFIPGNNPKMLISADLLGSDAIVIDLEDAVAPGEKDAARILVRNSIRTLQYRTKLGVRVNAVDTPHWKNDLRDIIPAGVDFIVLPKTNAASSVIAFFKELRSVEKEFSCQKKAKVIAMLETAEGIENAYQIAKADERVCGLFLGAEDLTSDLRAVRTKGSAEIFYSRSRMVCAARAAGIDAYDTPFTDVEDLDGLACDAEVARTLGFTGKAAISPRHIEVINKAFTPSEEELIYAREVLDAIEEGKRCGKGAVSLRGKMIDAPIVARAEYILNIGRMVEP